MTNIESARSLKFKYQYHHVSFATYPGAASIFLVAFAFNVVFTTKSLEIVYVTIN